MLQERRQYDEIVLTAFLRRGIKDPFKQQLREATRHLVASYSSSVRNASSGIMHLVKETCHDVADNKTLEALEEFFNKAIIRHLMLGTGQTSSVNDRVHTLQENHAEYQFTVLDTGMTRICTLTMQSSTSRI
jgi:hypothetical protein